MQTKYRLEFIVYNSSFTIYSLYFQKKNAYSKKDTANANTVIIRPNINTL